MNSLIVYFSKYGQTEKVARRIAQTIRSTGEVVELADIQQKLAITSIKDFDRIIFGSPIYVGAHSKQVAKFIKHFQSELTLKQTAFFSVSASASGNEDQRGDAEKCMAQFLEKCGFEPNHRTIFAGAITYTKYNWFIRMLMKWITGNAGGDTDTSKDFEYTNWKRVEEFSRSILSSNDVANGSRRVDNSTR